MNISIKERTMIVSKLLGGGQDVAMLAERDKAFLLNYFQFDKDISRTYIFYPIQTSDKKIVFKKGLLFGKNKEKNLKKLMESNIIGMMFFHAKFNQDMSFAASEKMRVNIFLNNPDVNTYDIESEKNLAFVNSVDDLPSAMLKRICNRYLEQSRVIEGA
jgi:hypothetical protein